MFSMGFLTYLGFYQRNELRKCTLCYLIANDNIFCFIFLKSDLIDDQPKYKYHN